MIPFAPQPSPSQLPERFPTPFDRAAVHPLARRAALELLAELESPARAAFGLNEPGGGKMFGVLIVERPDGIIGYLRAFSGMLDGRWDVEGYAPATFDADARDAVWLDGEAAMYAYAAERDALRDAGSHAKVAALEKERSARSRELLQQIQTSYHFTNARGDAKTLRELFAPAQPPGGAGDCAAPKLLAEAYRRALRPIALAEFWSGAPPRAGDRHARSFYPACRGKCAPILTHMLAGLPADPPPLFGAARFPASEPVAVFEDDWIVIVNKPGGMLSVPGRSAQLQDCVSSRLRARYPESSGQLVVHRLDLDTSGLLLAAKDSDTFVALQRLFSRREITKRYIAWLDGDVRGDQGTIDLALRLDVDDRPRQIHDPVHGKAAVTKWEVLERKNRRTKVALFPLTGRSHQLRVHTSHPLGLDAPIVGDRLYGRHAPADDARLLLHAESLTFVHPVTGEAISVVNVAPF